jgi:hypothetical protein
MTDVLGVSNFITKYKKTFQGNKSSSYTTNIRLFKVKLPFGDGMSTNTAKS